MDKVVHFEIPADNIARAQKFYKSVFGWKIDKVPEAKMEYYMVSTVEVDQKSRKPKEPGAINGGLMPRMQKGEAPVIVINVSNLDSYLKKVTTAGGKIVMPKMSVMDIGLYARFADPEGNIVGIWQDIKKR
ncbi:MAG: VOC family protein [Candidatus Aenigmarchaeota archaeon]|nr:VOC family protein [Candidatus Aenigmarchaeota archaeon]